MLKLSLKGAFHISPIVVALLEYYALSVAVMLLVAICYIKVFKLEAVIKESQGLEQEKLKKTCLWWKSFTFLQ